MNNNALRMIAVSGLVALGLSACGGGDTAQNGAASPAGPSSVSATTGTGQDAAATTDGAQAASTGAGDGGVSTGSTGSTGTTGTTGTHSGSGASTAAPAGLKRGKVTGATDSALQTYLKGRAAQATQQEHCTMGIQVKTIDGSYAAGEYFGSGCGGWHAIWHRAGGAWNEISAGQEEPTCASVAKYSDMPSTILDACLDASGKSVQRGQGSSAGQGKVTGGTPDLQRFLKKQLVTLNAGSPCITNADVEKQDGNYARGGYSGCGGAQAFWAKGANGWFEVEATQDVISCSTLQAKAPAMPTSIVSECYDQKEAHGTVPWKPAR